MKYVLAVCTHNAGRSQMLAAFLERHAPDDIRAESAGHDPAPAIWPNVLEAMREVGIELSDRRPKKLELEMQLHADWAITLACGDSCPYVPGVVEEWDVPDPAGLSLEEVREIRNEIERRVIDLVENRLDAICTDRSAHNRRLTQLLPPLVAEFDTTHSAEQIRACADAVLNRYDDAPVRSFVQPLALKATRQCLQADSCYELVS
jgi:protein-tyrosine-phosphatase